MSSEKIKINLEQQIVSEKKKKKKAFRSTRQTTDVWRKTRRQSQNMILSGKHYNSFG
jgi:hypothetical protein